MKVIIAGPRNRAANFDLIEEAISESGFTITQLVCGMANGIDTCAHNYASHYKIPIKEYPAKWDEFGRAAGPIRNKTMAFYADALIALWDGESKGTKNMIKVARELDLKVFVRYI